MTVTDAVRVEAVTPRRPADHFPACRVTKLPTSRALVDQTTPAVLTAPSSQSSPDVQVLGKLMQGSTVRGVDQGLRQRQTQRHLEVVTLVTLST